MAKWMSVAQWCYKTWRLTDEFESGTRIYTCYHDKGGFHSRVRIFPDGTVDGYLSDANGWAIPEYTVSREDGKSLIEVLSVVESGIFYTPGMCDELEDELR